MMEKEVAKAIRQIGKQDPAMKPLLKHAGEIALEAKDDHFETLVLSVVSQLISTKAADTIVGRMRAFTGGPFLPEVLAKVDLPQYRLFGIGAQKAGYLINLAEAFLNEGHRFVGLEDLEDKEVVKRLTQIKGIGKWTAEMFLIFGLARMDVFAPDDLGLRNAMIRHLGMQAEAKPAEFVKRAEIWAPYRSLACLALWRSLSMD